MTEDAFVINRLRRQPVTYTVEISHFVAAGEHQSGLKIDGIGPMDKRNAEAIVADLEWAIRMLRQDFSLGEPE